MDQTVPFADVVVRATAEIARLSRQRVQLVRDVDRARARFGPGNGAAEQAGRQADEAEVVARLAVIERDIEVQRVRERDARTELAKRNKSSDESLEKLEADAYRSRRPPTGQGIRLTESDFRRAQDSVPQGVFYAALLGVAVIAVVALSNLSLPNWLSILLAIASLVVPTALGLWAIYYARRQDKRASQSDGDPAPRVEAGA